MEAWSRLQNDLPNTRVLFAVQSPDAMLQDSCSRSKSRIAIAVDPGGRNARRYNAGWRPRAYVLGPDGTLLYAQPATTPDSQAPDEVRRLCAPQP